MAVALWTSLNFLISLAAAFFKFQRLFRASALTANTMCLVLMLTL